LPHTFYIFFLIVRCVFKFIYCVEVLYISKAQILPSDTMFNIHVSIAGILVHLQPQKSSI